MRRAIPILIATTVLLSLVRLFRVAQQYDPSAGQGPGYEEGGLGDVSVQFGRSEIISRSAGVRRWRLIADRIDLHRYPSGGLETVRSADFKGIHDGVLYREGRPEAYFSAQTAAFDHQQQRFDIKNGIHVKTVKGDQLESQECIWSDRDDFVRFPSGAHGKFGKNIVSAPFLLYAPKKRTVQCPQGADAVLEGYPVHATVLFWDLAAERVDFPGPINGERKGIKFTAARANLDMKRHVLHANDGTADLRIRGDGSGLEGIP